MSFTGDDLSKLMGFISIDDFYQAEGSHYMRPLIKALVTRLEAAEVIAEDHSSIYPNDPATIRWRKAAGK